LDKLIHKVTTAPVLACPDPEWQFHIEVNTSSFALGAVLFQKDKAGKRRDVAYFSKALSATECNYDIWDREFLVIVATFRAWRHLLSGTTIPVQVYTDHANLQYYHHLQKINRWVARYIGFLEDFNYQLRHIPGTCNRANTLSRRPDHDNGSGDNDQMVALPDDLFIRAISTATRDEELRRKQRERPHKIEVWKNKYRLVKGDDCTWYKGQVLVVVDSDKARKQLLRTYHEALTAGHPGASKTL
jgi:hypothetical protein